MTMLKICAMAVLVGAAVPAAAQSPLADAARREAARREAVRAASIPVYTNDDLSRLPPRPVPVRPVAPASTEVRTMGAGGDTAQSDTGAGDVTAVEGAEQAGTPAPAASSARGTEEQWRARITAARSSLSRAKLFAEALQSRINALSTDFVSRDDPAQRQQIFEDRQTALDEMARVQAEIAAFEKEIAAIQEEARRLNVPPGWLR